MVPHTHLLFHSLLEYVLLVNYDYLLEVPIPSFSVLSLNHYFPLRGPILTFVSSVFICLFPFAWNKLKDLKTKHFEYRKQVSFKCNSLWLALVIILKFGFIFPRILPWACPTGQFGRCKMNSLFRTLQLWGLAILQLGIEQMSPIKNVPFTSLTAIEAPGETQNNGKFWDWPLCQHFALILLQWWSDGLLIS